MSEWKLTYGVDFKSAASQFMICQKGSRNPQLINNKFVLYCCRFAVEAAADYEYTDFFYFT